FVSRQPRAAAQRGGDCGQPQGIRAEAELSAMGMPIVPKPRPGVLEVEPYRGGEATVAGVAKPIRLASNESALGPSPRATAAYAALAPEIHRYPDGGSEVLRRTIARHYGIAFDP